MNIEIVLKFQIAYFSQLTPKIATRLNFKQDCIDITCPIAIDVWIQVLFVSYPVIKKQPSTIAENTMYSYVQEVINFTFKFQLDFL